MIDITRQITQCVSLTAEETLHKFKTGEFPDKTFSNLYAKWLGISLTPGIVLEVRNKRIDNLYCITPEGRDFLSRYPSYLMRYDFRAQFENLEQWIEKRQVRPRPVLCQRQEISEKLQKFIERGCEFTDNFFIIVTAWSPEDLFILCTLNERITYVECSRDPVATHGRDDTKMCILQGGTALVNKTGLPVDVLMKVSDVSKVLTSVIGVNTICEYTYTDNILCLYTAQRSSSREMRLPTQYTQRMRVISPGTIEGIIKRIDKSSIPDVVLNLSKGNRKYVFLAEKPYSEFVDLLKFAEGFIFNEGSVLCHLAILLREKGIPAQIIHGSTLMYEDGDTVNLK